MAWRWGILVDRPLQIESTEPRFFGKRRGSQRCRRVAQRWNSLHHDAHLAVRDRKILMATVVSFLVTNKTHGNNQGRLKR